MRLSADFYHSEMVLDVSTIEPASEKTAMRAQIQEAMKRWRGKIKRITTADVSAAIRATNKRVSQEFRTRAQRIH